MDIHNNKKRIENNLLLLKEDEEISKNNKKLIIEFYEYLLSKDLSYSRVERYLTSLRVLARTSKIDLKKASFEDIKKLIVKIREGKLNSKSNTKTYSQWTQVEYKKALRKLYQYLKKPEIYKEININLKKKDRQRNIPKLEDLPTKEYCDKCKAPLNSELLSKQVTIDKLMNIVIDKPEFKKIILEASKELKKIIY